MKIFIGYDSKTGTAKECAYMLEKEFLLHDVTLFDLRKGVPEISGYDFIVIGGSIRMGRLSGYTTEFLKSCGEIIKNTPHAFYICCGSLEDSDDYIKKNFSKELLSTAVIASCFGGELKPERCRGIEKIIIKLARRYMMTNDDVDHPSEFKTLPSVLPENISYFADRIRDTF